MTHASPLIYLAQVVNLLGMPVVIVAQYHCAHDTNFIPELHSGELLALMWLDLVLLASM